MVTAPVNTSPNVFVIPAGRESTALNAFHIQDVLKGDLATSHGNAIVLKEFTVGISCL